MVTFSSLLFAVCSKRDAFYSLNFASYFPLIWGAFTKDGIVCNIV